MDSSTSIITTTPDDDNDDDDDDPSNAIVAELTLKIIYLCIGGVGLCGNLLVITVIVYYKRMRKLLTNTYLLSQSVLDATVAVFLILTSVFQDGGESMSGLGDEVYCRLWLTKMPLWGMLVSSTYNLVALSAERYIAVVHPIWHKMHLTQNMVLVSIAVAWLLGPVYNLAYMIPTAAIQKSGMCTVYSVWPNVTTQRAVGVLTILVQYLLPIVLLSFCYGRMAYVLQQRVGTINTRDELNTHTIQVPPQAEQQQQVPSDSTSKQQRRDAKHNPGMARARKNVIKTLAIVSACFIFCWTWNQIYYLMFNLGYPADFTSNFYHFTVVMVFFNCCINPFILMAKYEQFQTGLVKLCCHTREGWSGGRASQSRPSVTHT